MANVYVLYEESCTYSDCNQGIIGVFTTPEKAQGVADRCVEESIRRSLESIEQQNEWYKEHPDSFGYIASEEEEWGEWVGEFVVDRAMVRERIKGGYDAHSFTIALYELDHADETI